MVHVHKVASLLFSLLYDQEEEEEEGVVDWVHHPLLGLQ